MKYSELTPYQLGETGDIRAIEYLIRYLECGTSNEKRLSASAINKLSKIYREECNKAKEYLLRNLDNNYPQVRQYTLKALLQLDISDDDIYLIRKISRNDEKQYNKDLADEIISSFSSNRDLEEILSLSTSGSKTETEEDNTLIVTENECVKKTDIKLQDNNLGGKWNFLRIIERINTFILGIFNFYSRQKINEVHKPQERKELQREEEEEHNRQEQIELQGEDEEGRRGYRKIIYSYERTPIIEDGTQDIDDLNKLVNKMDYKGDYISDPVNKDDFKKLELEIDFEYFREEDSGEFKELQFEEQDLMEEILSFNYQYRIIAREYGDEEENNIDFYKILKMSGPGCLNVFEQLEVNYNNELENYKSQYGDVLNFDFRTMEEIGAEAENMVLMELKKLDNKYYKIIHNVMIPNSYGKTTQIDTIIISARGIFVIETKNYRGSIFGDEDSEY